MDKQNLKLGLIKQRILPGFEDGRYEATQHHDYGEFSSRSLDDNMHLGNKISIRVSASDLSLLKKRALEDGVPCQSLLANIIHDYVKAGLPDPSSKK